MTADDSGHSDGGELPMQTLESMLKTRYQRVPAPGEEDAALEVIALHFDGVATAEQSRRAEAALAQNPELAEAFATMRDAEGAQKVVSLASLRERTRAKQTTARRRSSVKLAAWAGAIAAAVIAAVGVSTMMPSTDKGDASGVMTASQSGSGSDVIIATSSAVGAVGAVDLAYGSRLPGYAAVLAVVPSGHVAALSPGAIALHKTTRSPLGPGRFDIKAAFGPTAAGSGTAHWEECVWIVTVTAHQPIDIGAAAKALGGRLGTLGRQGHGACEAPKLTTTLFDRAAPGGIRGVSVVTMVNGALVR